MIADPRPVDEVIRARMSVRAFSSKPVERQLITDILDVASRAPSGTNTQPWKVYVLQGASREALIKKVCAAHDAASHDPALADQYREDYDYYPAQWFDPYLARRRANGWGLYGLLGIGKGDKDKMHAQHQRNFCFFDAPVGLMMTVDKKLGRGSLLDYGMFIQNIMLAAKARGLDTCPQAAWNWYASIIKPHIGVPDNEMLVCAMSLGWADPDDKINTYVTPREPVESFTRWFD